jgi:hypothetical protein
MDLSDGRLSGIRDCLVRRREARLSVGRRTMLIQPWRSPLRLRERMLLRVPRLFYAVLGLLSALLPCAVRHVAVGYTLAAVVIRIIQRPSPEGREQCQPYKAYMPTDGPAWGGTSRTPSG